ncbi:MAG TPA: ABC transporter ATP-binding protein, partial [Polyangiaceae bacterium]
VSDALIRFSGVKKAFGPKVVYQGLNIDIQRGEAVTIVGGSGVGKSVMLKLLIGLLKADSGSIIFDGEEVTSMNERALSNVRRRIAMLFQSGALFDSLSVGDNVAYGLKEHYFREMNRTEIAERVAWALAAVDLPGIEAMRPSDLSGGMRKRVGLARAIALRPEVLLYDEPTTGLDPINTARVNHLILGLKQRMSITTVVVTHDMKSVFAISDRVAMVHGGRIIACAPVDEFRNSTDPRVSDFIEGRAPVKEDVETLLST